MSNEMKRKIGLWTALAISVGTTIGSGVFVTTASVGSAAGTPIFTILAWLIGGLVIIPQMMITSELATAYPEDGTGYLYIKKAGFEPLAFLYGWAFFWALDPPSISILAMSLVGYMAFFIPALSGFAGKLVAVAIIILLACIHYRSVKMGGIFQVIITLAKIIPLAVIFILGLIFMKSGNFAAAAATTDISPYKSLLGGISATSWAYVGMNAICYMSGELKEPGKNLPKALIGSAVVVTIIYTLVSISTIGLLPFGDMVNSSAPIADAISKIPSFAGAASAFVAFAAILVILGSLNSCIMVQPRLEYVMAKDNLFFKVFAQLHPKHETPHISLLIQIVYAIILVFLTDLTTLLGYFTLVLLIMNMLVFASINFCRKNNDYKPVFRCPAWRFMSIISIIITIWMAYGTFLWAPMQGTIAAIVIIVTGLPVYYFWKRKASDNKNNSITA